MRVNSVVPAEAGTAGDRARLSQAFRGPGLRRGEGKRFWGTKLSAYGPSPGPR